ncbi:hypothetical protein QBC32DRAFT_121818 [Pseudoneurospora amorphoporcata]|uniref:Uncharacterized protein n=1 Tax=Pseudoneurospora amorphoporcata TaxID=241081 RepID=A0AAN6NWM2_9PEZI|nr:hypothetical protein QBC32DRAFT_121818 [Pseudoneurospora amorphoporcata]
MTVNLDQVLFARAEWRIRFLTPCWMTQIGILLGLVCLFSYRLSVTSRTFEDETSHGQDPIVQIVWESTQVGFSSISVALTVAEIWKARSETLAPFFMLCTYLIKSTLASGMLGLDASVYIKYSDRHYSIVGLALDCILLGIILIMLFYAFYTYRRLLKFEAYDLAYNKLEGYSYSNARGPEKLGYTVKILGGKKNNREPSPTSEALRSRIDQAIGAEFGWGSRPSGSVTERSGIVVGSGSVQSGVPTRPAELHRARSWVTETGVVGPNTSAEHVDANERNAEDDYHDYYELAHARSLNIPTLVVTPHGEEGDNEALLTGQCR